MRLHQLSHGESFLEILRRNFTGPGLYVLDEPESPLSFEGCLIAVAYLLETARNGGQLLIATHSPVIAGIPGAKILELNADGWVDSEWADLSLVDQFRRFLCNPEGYLRHLG
jgi:predicted ATPase